MPTRDNDLSNKVKKVEEQTKIENIRRVWNIITRRKINYNKY